MGKRMTIKQRAALIRDIFNAEHDVVALAAAHELSPDELATWAGEAQTQRCLTGLCVLADMQTQLLLSRYRLLAASRLINLATGEQEGGGGDVARKACVDLLKLDLKRADASPDGDAGDGCGAAAEADALRAMVYGPGDGGGDSSGAAGGDEDE
ncbi:MAG: hypothetical protein WD009_04280 [Phycisphaeraceae bacterium]